MKLKIEINEDDEESIIINCKSLNDKVKNLAKLIEDELASHLKLNVYFNESEYYIEANDILYIETNDKLVVIHTTSNFYYSKLKLYELENMLPKYFERVSKSAILNIKHIYSISKSFSGSAIIGFTSSTKEVSVSRKYLKSLKYKIDKIRS